MLAQSVYDVATAIWSFILFGIIAIGIKTIMEDDDDD